MLLGKEVFAGRNNNFPKNKGGLAWGHNHGTIHRTKKDGNWYIYP